MKTRSRHSICPQGVVQQKSPVFCIVNGRQPHRRCKASPAGKHGVAVHRNRHRFHVNEKVEVSTW